MKTPWKAEPIRMDTLRRKHKHPWVGGMALVEAAMKLEDGLCLAYRIPRKVTYDIVRWGIYSAARLRGVHMSTYRDGRTIRIVPKPVHPRSAKP